MTTLTLPSFIVPNQLTWHLEPNTGVFASPLTRAAQTIELPGARWVCEMGLPSMAPARWRAYTAWIAKMRGQSGRVYVTPPHYLGITAPTWTPNPSALRADNATVTADSSALVNQESRSAWGTPVIDGASQAGDSVRTRGWVNDAQVMAAGDYLSYDTTRGRTLHMVVEDAISDGYGEVSIRVEPPIRTAPADGAVVETQAPSCVMTLQGGMTGAPSFGYGLRVSVNLSLVEVF
jgi:hypothetical protein